MALSELSGAMAPGSETRIPRQFEAQALNELSAGRWVLLLGPRQHGKTTGLLWLKQELGHRGFRCALVDLQRMPPCSEYEQLLEWFATAIARQLLTTVREIPTGVHARDLLSWLEVVFPPGLDPLVVLVDEAPTIRNDEWRNTFYGQIRAITSDRPTATQDQVPARLRMLFSGTFRPERLVLPMNSPFNVCTRIETDDLTVDMAKELWRRVTQSDPNELADRAYALVGGQPYLLQAIFSHLASVDPTERDGEYSAIVALLSSGADGHFDGSFGQVVASQALSTIVRRIVREGSSSNEPANADFKYLIVLGVAKRDGTKIVFRNLLYQQFASSSSQLAQDFVTQGTSMSIAISPLGSYDFMHDTRLKEIAESADRGGVLAYRVGNFRLALAGFGCALEATLLDWLMSINSRERQTAVNSAKVAQPAERANFNQLENESDPGTWRLVNLMRVAKFVSTGVRVVDPPHALRQYRNLIHPAEAIKSYLPEQELRPEADAAAALLAGIRRDLS
jgi:hypothetical protein